MKRIAGLGLILLLACLPLAGQTIKLGSVAPVGSPWHTALLQLASDWGRISGGRVQLKLFMGGIAGDEPDILRKIRIGQLQAAALTGLGLNHITPEILALSIPFLIRTEGELDDVLEHTRPFFTDLLEQRGFVVLALSKAGWVHFFAKDPVVYPEDLKRQTLAVHAGDNSILDAWRNLGFDAVPLAIPDVMVGLQSGMVDALYSPPLVTAGYQWFGIARNMGALRVAPVIGGIVVNRRVWDRVPAEIRPEMEEAVRRIDHSLYQQTLALEQEALAVMLRHGLVINELPKDAEERWRTQTEKGFDGVVGKTFSQATYDLVTRHLAEYRSSGAP